MNNRELPKRRHIIEEYKNFKCINYEKYIHIYIKENNDGDFSDLHRVLEKYPNANININKFYKLSELNTVCDLLEHKSYSGKVTLNLINTYSEKGFIDGLKNNERINIDDLPDYVEINGFFKNNKQNDFSLWAHNLNDIDKRKLFKHLCLSDKAIFLEQEKVIKEFMSELMQKHPNIMSYDEKTRFEIVFKYVNENFRYEYECIDPNNPEGNTLGGPLNPAHDAVETYKRRKGVCDGRSSLLALVTNNSYLKCNCFIIDGRTAPSAKYPEGQPHGWNVFIDRDGRAYFYDLSFAIVARDIHNLEGRTLNICYNSVVYDKLERLFSLTQLSQRGDDIRNVPPPLPPRKASIGSMPPPLPPRRASIGSMPPPLPLRRANIGSVPPPLPPRRRVMKNHSDKGEL